VVADEPGLGFPGNSMWLAGSYVLDSTLPVIRSIRLPVNPDAVE
jgi:hypothetical protein